MVLRRRPLASIASKIFLTCACVLLLHEAQGWVVSTKVHGARESASSVSTWHQPSQQQRHRQLPHYAALVTARSSSSLLSSSSSSSPSNSQSLLEAFAGLTQASCKLLGVKSVGVDYGLVRTGIAKTAGYQPQAVEILSDLNATQVSERAVRLAQLEGASKLIVGLPLHKNGTVAEQTNLTIAFAQVLAQVSLRTLGPDVSVELWDERYTSKEAAARAHARNPHQTLYGMLDAEAACIILEQYYNDNGKDAQIIQVQDEEIRAACLEVYYQQQEKDNAQKISYLDERERLLQRRKEAMERDQKQAATEATSSGKKKKKKKRR